MVYGTKMAPDTYNLIVHIMLYKGGGKKKEDRKSYRACLVDDKSRSEAGSNVPPAATD